MIKVKLMRVTAIDPCIMLGSGVAALKVGQVYDVISMRGNSVVIRDEQGDQHPFLNDEAGKHIFKSKYLQVTTCMFLEASGKVRLTDEGLEYFVGWFRKGGAEDAARKRHLKGKGFKVVQKDGSSIKIKCKDEEWWVSAQQLDFRDIILVKE